MKQKKILLTALGTAIMLFFTSVKSYAFMPRIVYNKVNLIIARIMKYAIPIFIISYIIFAIIYIKKSKNDKKVKIKKLAILLLINIIVVIALYFGADMVLEAGKTYTSSPRNIPRNW